MNDVGKRAVFSKADMARLVAVGPLFAINAVIMLVPFIMLFKSLVNRAGLVVILVVLALLETGFFFLIYGPFKRWNRSRETLITASAGTLSYASFLDRFAAGCIDTALFCLPIILHYSIKHWTLASVLAIRAVGMLDYPYVLFLIAWRGQTLGKYVMRIRVHQVNGDAATLGNSFRRSSIDLVYYVLYAAGLVISARHLAGRDLSGLPYGKISSLMYKANPLFHFEFAFSMIWLLSEYVSMLFNERKRALHDFLGGTVVLKVKRPV